ncbi:MAG: hypothetical protein K8R23_03700 [Chthoniobacter sp.]|nr:hypothetical protein [Chthoniobacter sp.]
MSSKLEGDYSRYPTSVRDIFPYLCGEVVQLRETWEVFRRLFMEDKALTELLVERLGPLLGTTQNLLQDELLLTLSRLTDNSKWKDPILSLWSLEAAISPNNPTFQSTVRTELAAMKLQAENITKHRHKRIAHLDRAVAIQVTKLPTVTFTEIHGLLERIEAFLNLFYREFEGSTMRFDSMSGDDITSVAEITALKAKAYDSFVRSGTVPKFAWRNEKPV